MKVQHHISLALRDADCSFFLKSGPAHLAAHVRAYLGSASTCWLGAAPVRPSLLIPNELFQYALRRLCHVPYPFSVADLRCRCGAAVDPWGSHFLSCFSFTKERYLFHNFIVDSLVKWCGQAGLKHVRSEVALFNIGRRNNSLFTISE